MLAGAAERDLSIELFGMTLPSPLLLAPVGVIGLCAQDGHGDLATARAAARTGVPMIASTLTVDPLEDVAPLLGDTPGFFQLYTPADRDLAESFVRACRGRRLQGHRRHARHAGSSAGGRATCALGSFPQLRGPLPGQLLLRPGVPGQARRSRRRRTCGRRRCTGRSAFGNPALTWDDLAWLRSLTTLPLLLKGICHPDDVRRAIDGGVDGIYCSNHGGRQANGGAAAHRHAARGRRGRRRRAGDLRLRRARPASTSSRRSRSARPPSASAAPTPTALALGGEDGIVHVLRSLLAEADLLMAVDGYPTVADLMLKGSIRGDPE